VVVFFAVERKKNIKRAQRTEFQYKMELHFAFQKQNKKQTKQNKDKDKEKDKDKDKKKQTNCWRPAQLDCGGCCDQPPPTPPTPLSLTHARRVQGIPIGGFGGNRDSPGGKASRPEAGG
jgi:hypothetical protein